MYKTLLIFLAGGTGSALRYGISKLLNEHTASTLWSWGTFSVNILGCLLIGICYTLAEKLQLSTEVRLLLTTGFCGGFTTFSTFSQEAFAFLKEGSYILFGVYISMSIVLGIVAVALGAHIIKG